MKMVLFLVGALAFCLYFYGLDHRDFWAPDEGDFAQVVRELDDNYLVPHLNGTPYAEKPPLFYYLAGLSRKIFASAPDEQSTRFVSAAFAVLAALFFALTIVRAEGMRCAIVSALMLIVTPLFYWQARYLQVDMLFSSLVVCTLLSFFHFTETRRKAFLYLSAFCLGLAFMTKGPAAVALAVPVTFAYLAYEKNLRSIWRKEYLWALSLFLAVVIPWYLAVGFQEGSSFLYENVIRQNFIRFFDAWSHKRPVYYYLTTFPLDFFPWSLFLPMGLIVAIRRIRQDRMSRFCVIWFVWIFLFLSISSGKISKYMLPLVPAACLISSLPLVNMARRYNSFVFVFLGAVFLALAGFLLFYRTEIYPEFHFERLIIAGICLLLTACIIVFSLRHSYFTAFIALFTGLLLILMVGNLSIYTKFNAYKSPREFSAAVRSYLRDGTPWVYYGSMRGVYVYYIGQQAISVGEHETDKLTEVSNRLDDFYILTRKRDLGEVRKTIGEVEPVLERRIGETDMVFVRFRGRQ